MSRFPPERWPEVERLLERLFELEGEARDRALLEATAGDEALRAEVRSLLAADTTNRDDLAGFLEAGVAPFAGEVDLDETMEDLIPASRTLGPYRLDRILGTGGMSVVYLGHRDDGEYEQDVAVKLMRHPGRHPELDHRFRVERQILAHLRHPNIARIVDGGVTPQGHPYLVMEYVDGLPVTRYCSERGLSLDRRLRLFETICEAVHHAHQRLVVHRDLKPSNILVTEGATPKLLDFGIAKLLEDEDSEGTVPLTRTGLRLFTPDYAAPEQVRGESVTTATDVYALGILLYEMLSGDRPYRLQGHGAVDIDRVVCEEDPPAPSTAVTRIDGAEVTRVFDEDARRLRSRLKGDLDVITLKALRKEPEHRYLTARELADDLRRYRTGQPVSARPATASYRFGKFARRNRTTLAATILVVLLSIGFGVVSTVERQRTEAARIEAITARTVAEDEAAKSEEVTEFLIELFRASDPRQARADTLSVRTLLRQGVARIEELRDRPRVYGALLDVMGRAHTESGDLDEGERLLREAMAVMDSEPDFDPADKTTSMAHLARNRGLAFDLRTALDLRRETLTRRIEESGPGSRATVIALNALGQVHLELEESAAAESLLTRARDRARALGTDGLELGVAIESNLAALHASRGDFRTASTLAESVLVRRRELLGDDHLDVGQDLHNLAAYSRRMGDAPRAEALYRESIAIKRLRLPSPNETIARSLDNLAIAIGVQGRYAEAETLFLEALEMRRAMYGDEHRQVAASLANLTTLMTRMQRDAEGLQYAERAVAIYRNATDTPASRLASALRNQATLLLRLDRVDEAARASRESLALYVDTHGETSTFAARARGNLAAVLLRQGNATEAERLRREAIEIQSETLGARHPDVATDHVGLGEALAAQNRVAEADSALARALSIRESRLGPEHPRTTQVREALDKLRRR